MAGLIRLFAAGVLLSQLACSAGPSPTPTATTPLGALFRVPLCDDVPYLEAPAEWYRDSPVYVANEMDDEIATIQNWARSKPGFEELWIDRRHHGWISLAFSVDAELRQEELASALPDVGVVVVPVEWTMQGLLDLQRRVAAVLGPIVPSVSTGTLVMQGVVSVNIGFLRPEWLAVLDATFAGQPVCVEGADPALAPVEGPQPLGGPGWRLLADQDEVGWSYRTGIAYDALSFEELWSDARLMGDPPAVDFENEVAIWFGAVHGSSCPRMRLDGVVIDHERGLVHANLTYLDSGVCTADAIPHAYVVAVERAQLPHGPFSIQLDADGPPRGAPEERTVVDADLSQPGATPAAGQVGPDPNLPEPYFVEPGDFIEPGFGQDYRQSSECGLGWLGPLNATTWRTPDAQGVNWIPDGWRDVIQDGQIVLTVEISVDPPLLTASAGDLTVAYEPALETAPPCR